MHIERSKLLRTEIGLLPDDHVSELVQELTDIRTGHFFPSPNLLLYDFLTVFFLPGDQTKFVPIKPAEVPLCRLLTSKVDHLKTTSVQNIVHELVPLAGSHQDNHGHQELYVALNALMKPICLSLRKDTRRTKPRRRLR